MLPKKLRQKLMIALLMAILVIGTFKLPLLAKEKEGSGFPARVFAILP